jgi:hypothetical protein
MSAPYSLIYDVDDIQWAKESQFHRRMVSSHPKKTQNSFGIQYYVVFNSKLEVTSSRQVRDKHFR